MALGLNVYNEQGQSIFSTEDKLFKLIGFKDLKYGKFSFTVSENFSGTLFFIPVYINTVYVAQPTAFGTSIPNIVHLKKCTIVNTTVSGEITCMFDFGNLPKDDNYYIRIYYGVY